MRGLGFPVELPTEFIGLEVQKTALRIHGIAACLRDLTYYCAITELCAESLKRFGRGLTTVLESVRLFAGLDDHELEAIESLAVRKRYRRNTILMEHGDQATTLFLIVSGRVKVYRIGDGNKEVVYREAGPGSYVGELALLVGGTRSASVETLEDSEFLVLTRQSFESLISKHPKIARTLLYDLAERVREVTDEFGNLALLDVYGRVVKLLEHEAIEHDGYLVTHKLTHQEIANRVGSSREMVTKILKDLRVGGYIEVDRKHISLLRPLPRHW